MRRAMSCATWEPKSRIRIRSTLLPCFDACGWCCMLPMSVHPVVRGFLGDLHVVHVRFAHAGGSDLDELGLRAHLLDGGASRIAHAGAQPPHQLVDDRDRRALVR